MITQEGKVILCLCVILLWQIILSNQIPYFSRVKHFQPMIYLIALQHLPLFDCWEKWIFAHFWICINFKTLTTPSPSIITRVQASSFFTCGGLAFPTYAKYFITYFCITNFLLYNKSSNSSQSQTLSTLSRCCFPWHNEQGLALSSKALKEI